MLHMKEEMLQMKDEIIVKDKAYEAVDVSSVEAISPRGFDQDTADTGLSPRRGDRKAHRDHQHRHRVAEADFDTQQRNINGSSGGTGSSQDTFDSEGKPRRLRLASEDEDEDGNEVQFDVSAIMVDREIPGGPKPTWERVYEVLYQSNTPSGQKLALMLLVLVSLSVVCAVLDSVKEIRDDVGDFMMGFEIFFTVVFSIEYLLRVVCVRRPAEFIFSLFGFIDICALVPSYLGFFIPSARPLIHLAVLRIFRVMRVFRVLRLARFVDASTALSDNIQSNKRRIVVFLVGLFTMILVIGCAMYLIEGGHDFDNIPVSLYWTVVTITTVGYGDIAPQTIMGRLVATVVMFAGYGIIACPLVLNQTDRHGELRKAAECPRCYRRFHQDDANFCRVCGSSLRLPRGQNTPQDLTSRSVRLEKLRLATPDLMPMSSTTSTTKSSSHLLMDPNEKPRAHV